MNNNGLIKISSVVLLLILMLLSPITLADRKDKDDDDKDKDKDQTIECPAVSSYAGQVQINEIHVSDEWVELYVESTGSAENINFEDWRLLGNRAGGSDEWDIKLCDSDCRFEAGVFVIFAEDDDQDTIEDALDAGQLKQGSTLFTDGDIDLHGTQQELVLLDDAGQLVHYYVYANNENSFNTQTKWTDCDNSPQSDYATVFLENGNKNHICSLPDGELPEGKWSSSCPEVTPGGSNLGQCGVASPYAGQVMINEVHTKEDWLELYFQGGASNLDLQGWQLQVADPDDGDIEVRIELCDEACAFDDGDFVVFAEDDDEDYIEDGLDFDDLEKNNNLFIRDDISFDDKEHELLLVDAQGRFVHYFGYNESANYSGRQSWQVCAQSNYATKFIELGDKDHMCTLPDGEFNPSNWSKSCPEVNPGRSNLGFCDAASPYAGKIFINEIHADDSWLELYVENTANASTVNFKDWKLFGVRDRDDDDDDDGKKFGAVLCEYDCEFAVNDFIVFSEKDSKDSIKDGIRRGDIDQQTNLIINKSVDLDKKEQELLLVDADNKFVQYFSYSDERNFSPYSAWQMCAQSSAATAIRKDDHADHICSLPDGQLAASDWSASCDAFTPGKTNQQSQATGVEYFLIELPASPLSICANGEITVKACADESCSSLYTEAVGASLVATKSVGNNITTALTFANGTATVNIAETTLQTVSYSLTDLSLETSSVTQCTGGDGSCAINYDGSVAYSVAASSSTCPTLNATVRAYEYDLDSQQCSELSGSHTLSVGFSYQNPTAGTEQVTFSGDNSTATVSAGQRANIQIVLASNDNLTLSYADSGQVSLSVSDPAGQIISASNTTATLWPSAIALTSNETEFVAGKPFNLNVVASCDNGSQANNYVPGDALWTVQRVEPQSGADGVFTIASQNVEIGVSGQSQTGTGSFTSASVNDASYSEWGKFAVSLTDRNYFNKTNLTTASQTFGRFTASSVKVDINHGELSSDNGYVYIGKPFSYQALPSITLSGLHFDGVTTLKNYPVQDKLGLNFTLSESNGRSLDGTVNNVSDPVSSQGQHTYTLDALDQFWYVKGAAPLAAFESGIELVDNNGFTDSDGITSTQPITIVPQSVELRYGRFYPTEVAGSVNSVIAPQFVMQYYTANGWVTNGADSTSSFSGYFVTSPQSVSGNYTSGFSVALNDGLDSTITDVTVSYPFTAGSGVFNNLTLAADGFDNGRVYFVWDPAMPTWMQSDWGAGSLSAPPPTAIVFGEFSGNDRIITWRELN